MDSAGICSEDGGPTAGIVLAADTTGGASGTTLEAPENEPLGSDKELLCCDCRIRSGVYS